MSTTKTALITTLAATAALVPAAGAATSHLGGAPQIKGTDAAKTATLTFAADRRPDSITFAGGQKAHVLHRTGTHGHDRTFRATVTSRTAFAANRKYTVTFRFGGARETRKVTFHAAG